MREDNPMREDRDDRERCEKCMVFSEGLVGCYQEFTKHVYQNGDNKRKKEMFSEQLVCERVTPLQVVPTGNLWGKSY